MMSLSFIIILFYSSIILKRKLYLIVDADLADVGFKRKVRKSFVISSFQANSG